MTTPYRTAILAAGLVVLFSIAGFRATGDEHDGWSALPVPGAWQEVGPPDLAEHDGHAWYRSFVRVPEGWAQRWELTLSLEHIGDAYELFFNGERIAQVGALPPDFEDASGEAHRHTIPSDLVDRGELNLIAIRVYSEGGHGGFRGRSPALTDYQHEIVLEGPWQFRRGDDPAFAAVPDEAPADVPVYEQVVAATQVRAEPSVYHPGQTLPAEESMDVTQVADDLALEVVLAEPDIEQPLHISFDERGRLWLVEYRQYPYPAGLRAVSRDIYWRMVWEPDLPPPPYHADSPFLGRDRISVHEDTTGDGEYDASHVFLDGLNITTAVAHGRGGVWVLSPPQLLFYPTEDDGLTIAGEPEVHLEGFNLEDTHAVVNSLTWGPDGWLYATQGSTVTGAVRRPGSDDAPVRSIGQNIWRYHPETGEYEIFAEGGGNAFGVEFDSVGRVYSGHNGGNTRGFHYVQGGYHWKGFGKHGPHSNPYTFGYFDPMEHDPVERFTHTFLIYEADHLPARYRGNLLALEPMQGRIVHTALHPMGSTFHTEDLDRPVISDDPAFRPVDIKLAPDGSVYIADFYSQYVAHGEAYEGYINREAGRVYRLRAAEGEAERTDLSGRSTDELIDLLEHDNRWVRRSSLRLLGDTRDADALPRLRQMIEHRQGQAALEALWAYHVIEGDLDAIAALGLEHASPHVRRWTVRLLGDDRTVTAEQARRLAELAHDEGDAEVRSQLASTARRLPADIGLAIVAGLITHDEDATDRYQPLLIWWAIEAHCEPESRDAVVELFESPGVWDRPLVTEHLLTRVMRRLAATDRRSDLLAGARLLELAPDRERAGILIEGLEQAYEHRTLSDLPGRLAEAMAEAGVGSRTLAVRQGDAAAIDEALAILGDDAADARQRREYARLFGEVVEPRSVDVLLDVVAHAESTDLRTTALASLRRYRDAEIAERILDTYESLPAEVRPAAHTLLASRQRWSLQWLEAIDAGDVDPAGVSAEIIEALRLHEDEAVQTLVHQHFVDTRPAPAEDVRAEMERIQRIVREPSAEADPYAGHPIYMANCGACHQMFGQGGRLGPDLTSYQRDDLLALIRSVVDPNADIRDGYEAVIVSTTDDRTIVGLLADADDDALVVRSLDGQETTIPTADVADRRAMERSLMPENLLGHLSEQEIRDLFAFLRSTQPIQP